ncbi:hypothetical protein ACO1MN_14400, partial [Staphylococcus aureus]
MTAWQWAGVGLAALLFFWGVGAYTRLMALRNAIGDAFVQLDAHLKARAEALVLSRPDDPAATMGPLISRAHRDKVLS